jgi:hypothetical protein
MKEFKAFENFMEIDAQIDALEKIIQKIEKGSKKQADEYIDETISLLANLKNFDVSVARSIVFSFQTMMTIDALDLSRKKKVYKELLKLSQIILFQKNYSFSNAVSLTLRFFYNDTEFPKSEIKSGYEYLLKNMKPISSGWGSRRCQVCWNKTFKDLITILEIPLTRELKTTIYNITLLNVFTDQLGDSYDSEMNTLTNSFYKKLFGNIKEILVHDVKSADTATKIKDKALQRQGIDKTLVLKDGKKIFVEEKFREHKFWEIRFQDILLEYISIDNKNVPGWIYTSKSDYLVVVFKGIDVHESELYIFPFKPIKQWVRDNPIAFKKFKDIIAPNTHWNTISKAVPLKVIIEILKDEPLEFRQIHKI